MINNEKSIKNHQVIIIGIILLVPFIIQGYLFEVGIFRIIFTIARIISFCFVVIWYVLIYKKISYIMLILLLFQLCMFISTAMNEYSDYVRYFNFCITSIGLCMLTEILIKMDFKLVCICNIIPLFLLAIVNFVSIILYPSGLPSYKSIISGDMSWFLGYYNSHILVLFPLMYFITLYTYFTKRKLTLLAVLMILLPTITIFIIWSATSVITVSLFLVFVIILMNIKNGSLFNIRNYYIVAGILFLVVVVFRVQEHFMDVIEIVLRRSTTLLSRGSRWDSYYAYIQQKPLIGYGFEETSYFATKHGNLNAHNFYLEILYLGGIAAFSLFIIMLVMASKKLMKHKSNCLAFVLSFVFFIYMVRFLAESHMTNPRYIFVWFVLSYHIESIIEQQSKAALEPNTSHIRANPRC